MKKKIPLKMPRHSSCHTDLALEKKEEIEECSNLEGVKVVTKKDGRHGILKTEIEIVNELGEKSLGKPVGHYTTLEIKDFRRKGVYAGLEEILTSEIKKYVKGAETILVVGLGNRNVTPDSIGPKVVDKLMVTGHFFENNPDLSKDKKMKCLSAIAPGVMGQTGMETVDIIKGIVASCNPDVVIVIDALAARSSKRLNRTIQICDTGIHPGAGVGNHRQEITKNTLGIKVVALGVPTVIAVPTIICDAMQELLIHLHKEGIAQMYEELSFDEQYELAGELIRPYFADMFVTPKNIDEEVERVSGCIAMGINQYIAGKAAYNE